MWHRTEIHEERLQGWHVDPLEDAYRESVTEVPERRVSIEKHKTALLVIDLQYLDAAPGYGVFADIEESGVPVESQEYYFKRLDHIVLPNVSRLQRLFRENGLEVIHTRIQSLTQDGRERSPGHKRLGLHAPPGSKEAEFLPEVAPKRDEIIISKTASGVFNATSIDQVLRNLRIENLVITGVVTNNCVENAVRDACDRGYGVVVVEDGCGAVSEELHLAAIRAMNDHFAKVKSTEEVVELINAI